MWNATCCEKYQRHVEERASDRIINYSRILNESHTEAEIKEKILNLMRTSENKHYIEMDKETNLPKYYLTEYLSNSRIKVYLCVIEDKQKKERKIKTLFTEWEKIFPNF